MTVLLPRDENASRNGGNAKAAKPAAQDSVTSKKARDINTPHVAKIGEGNAALNKNTKKVFIKTYGCQMNVYDSERMADVLAPIGYAPVEAPDHADLVILNTCHIREKAAEKVYSELGRIRQHKEKNLSLIHISEPTRPY